MSLEFAEVEELARGLAAEDRARLAVQMLESLHETLDVEAANAWEAEVERRLAQLERGEAGLVEASEVFARARKVLG